MTPAVIVAGNAYVVTPANTRSPAGTAAVFPVRTALPRPPVQAPEMNVMKGEIPEYSAMDARSRPDVAVSVTLVSPGRVLGRYQIDA